MAERSWAQGVTAKVPGRNLQVLPFKMQREWCNSLAVLTEILADLWRYVDEIKIVILNLLYTLPGYGWDVFSLINFRAR